MQSPCMISDHLGCAMGISDHQEENLENAFVSSYKQPVVTCLHAFTLRLQLETYPLMWDLHSLPRRGSPPYKGVSKVLAYHTCSETGFLLSFGSPFLCRVPRPSVRVGPQRTHL